MRLIRDLFLLAVAAAVSYLVLLHRTEEPPAAPEGTSPTPVELTVAPSVEEEPVPPVAEDPPPPPPPEPPDLVERAGEPPVETPPEPRETAATSPPPAPESGTPEGEENGPGDAANPAPEEPVPAPPTAEEEAERLREEIRGLAASAELRHEATEELAGRARRGFRTVFLCAARDQLAIARWFDEALVLVPRAGLDPDHPYHYRLETHEPARVVRVAEAAPLARFRQYRDLFAFPYGTLPGPLRDLRRSVFNRGDVYLFAALVPPSEWAVVIARRRAALRTYNARRSGPPRTLDDVRRVTMRYVPLAGGGFDIRVAQILFADGTHWTRN
jgi:hypothetical protein